LRPCSQCVKRLSLRGDLISLAASALLEIRPDRANPAIDNLSDDGMLLGASFCDRD
jgi:hypothetical protein